MAYEAYIVTTDYTGTYKGSDIPAADFDRLAMRASDELDAMTMRQVRTAGLSSFSTDNQELIKMAVCALAEGLCQQDQATGGTGIVTSSEKIGGYSYTQDQAALDKAWRDAVDCAENYLLFTGLLYRGVRQA